MAADINAITTTMAAHAGGLDQQVADLKAQAAEVVTQAQREGDEHMARARRTAEDLVAKAKGAAANLLRQADEAEETAAHWRRMAYAERTAAKLPPLEVSTPAEETPTTWKGPDGHEWDLTIRYIDGSKALWHWAGGVETVDGVAWPLMSRSDYSLVDIPLLKCPPLTATSEVVDQPVAGV